MKRKIFSKLLMGALLVASVSSFVSCKDYDDDINNLQDQINAKAALSELSALQSTLDSKIAAAQSAAQAAQATADKAATATSVAELQAALEQAIAAAKQAGTDAGTEAGKAIAAANKAQETADAAAAAAKKADEDAKAALAKALEDIKAAYATKAEAAAAATAAATAQSTADAAKTAAEAAQKAADAAKAVADAAYTKAAAEELKKEVEELKTTLEGLQESLEASIDEKIKDAIQEVNNAAASVDAIWSAVTSVELIGSVGTANNFVSPILPLDLLFFNGTKVENNAFGKADDIDEPEHYVAGDKIEVDNPIIVRVNPVNATFTKEMVKLINSKGEDFSDYAIVDKVEPYTELITRAEGNSGLWKVTLVRNTEKTDADFAKETKGKKNQGQVLYALAINNTADADRFAATTFDLGVIYGDYVSQHFIDFDVNGENIANIKNRWKKDGANYYIQSERGDWRKTAEYNELKWIAEAADAKGKATGKTAVKSGKGGADVPAVEAITTGDAPNAELDKDDARYGKDLLPVSIGEDIVISGVCAPYPHAVGKLGQAYAQYYYVTLDMKNAIESYPSEKNAWEKYEFTGLNKKTNWREPLTITIESEKAYGDVIGFRLYAVNYDGTLVDPDGKAFYVQVGDAEKPAVPEVMATGESAEAALLAKSVVMDAEGGAESEKFAFDASAEDLLKGIEFDKVVWNENGIENPDYFSGKGATAGSVSATRPFEVTFYDGTGATAKKVTVANASDLAKVKAYTIKYAPEELGNGLTYAKKLALVQTTNSDDGDTIRYISFAVQKVLPTALPAKAKLELTDAFANAANQVTAFMAPTAGKTVQVAAAEAASANMTLTFTGATYPAANMQAVFKNNDEAAKLGILFAASDTVRVGVKNADYVALSAADKAKVPFNAYYKKVGGYENTAAKSYWFNLSYSNFDNLYVGTLAQIKAGTQALNIPFASLVDGKTAHKVLATYNFGQISRPVSNAGVVATAAETYYGTSAKNDAYGNPTNGIDTGISFIYASWLDAYKFSWGSVETHAALTAATPAVAAKTATVSAWVPFEPTAGNTQDLKYDYFPTTDNKVYDANTPKNVTEAMIMMTNEGKYPSTTYNKWTDLTRTTAGFNNALPVGNIYINPVWNTSFAANTVMTGTDNAIITGANVAVKADTQNAILTSGIYTDAACTEKSGIYELAAFGGGKITLRSIAPASTSYNGGTQYLCLYVFDAFSGAESNFIYETAAGAPVYTNISGLKHYKKIVLPFTVKASGAAARQK